jgi:hypothetical protein
MLKHTDELRGNVGFASLGWVRRCFNYIVSLCFLNSLDMFRGKPRKNNKKKLTIWKDNRDFPYTFFPLASFVSLVILYAPKA